MNSSWHLLAAPDGGPYFITSDNPGMSVGDDKVHYNTKFKNGFTFYFPLSNKFCLVITDEETISDGFSNKYEKFLPKLPINGYGVIAINDRLIQFANKLLIGSDDWYLLQIAEINKPTSNGGKS